MECVAVPRRVHFYSEPKTQYTKTKTHNTIKRIYRTNFSDHDGTRWEMNTMRVFELQMRYRCLLGLGIDSKMNFVVKNGYPYIFWNVLAGDGLLLFSLRFGSLIVFVLYRSVPEVLIRIFKKYILYILNADSMGSLISVISL